MPHPHAAEMRLVEQGEAGREQLAIDDAFAEPRDDAKADAPGQLGQRFADAAHIVRIDMLKAVAKDDPVDRPPVGLGARLARVPDQLRIEAGARDLKGFGVDLSDQVEIDEAVVDRGNRSEEHTSELQSLMSISY